MSPQDRFEAFQMCCGARAEDHRTKAVLLTLLKLLLQSYRGCEQEIV